MKEYFNVCQCADLYFNLAKHVANADSGTCGPHTGSSPLHLVLAFWRAALSHSSRPRASLLRRKGKLKISVILNETSQDHSRKFLRSSERQQVNADAVT